MGSIKAWWHYSENFGDRLTPYLLNKITKKEVKYIDPTTNDSSIYCLTGSLLGSNLNGCIVLGLGSAFSNFSVKPNINTKYLSVRGPLSKSIIEKSGYKVEMVGDGAFLLPKVYSPKINKQYKLGILQSWVDIDITRKLYENEKDILVIDTMRQVEPVIDDILKCEMTISSCLHGLITSIIYGIPSYHVKFSDKMVGDGFKFLDFKKSVDYEHEEITANNSKISDLIKLPFLPKDLNIEPIQDFLIKSIV